MAFVGATVEWLCAVDVAAMVDADNGDCSFVVVDSVEDPVGPTASTVDPCEFVSQFSANSLWFENEWTGDEIDHRCGDGFRKVLSDCSSSGTSHDKLVWFAHLASFGRSARTASTPRTTSP